MTTPSTTRSQAAAEEIVSAIVPVMKHIGYRAINGGRTFADEMSLSIASHYADLEAAAVLARDALELSHALACAFEDTDGGRPTQMIHQIKETLSALNAALAQDSKTPLERGEAK